MSSISRTPRRPFCALSALFDFTLHLSRISGYYCRVNFPLDPSQISSLLTALGVYGLLYAGAFMTIYPGKFVVLFNKTSNKLHQLHLDLEWRYGFAAPDPVPNTVTSRVVIRLTGVFVVATAMLRLIETASRLFSS